MFNWSPEATFELIDAAKQVKLVEKSDSTSVRNVVVMKEVAGMLVEKGYRDIEVVTVKNKWKRLKAKYNHIRTKTSQSGESSKSALNWPYFRAMHELLGCRPRVQALASMIGVDTSEPSIMQDHSFDETIAQFVAEIEVDNPDSSLLQEESEGELQQDLPQFDESVSHAPPTSSQRGRRRQSSRENYDSRTEALLRVFREG
uniref:uncharacterized protein LOC120343879 n=1 Tax=Styela clava TaxID=7725 RepID=UPI00193A522D|nr:uncharacterized protein LOC120343879 [Styela clava]